ncbi:MAG: type II toxin-antitoxin system PemK/MazF family toxin, partial [Oscillospiraceae bacterium]
NKGLSKSSIALFEQIRTIDKSRLSEYIGTLDSETMKQVDMALEISFGIKKTEVQNG